MSRVVGALGTLFARASTNGHSHTNGSGHADSQESGTLKQTLLSNGTGNGFMSVTGKNGTPEPEPFYATMRDPREIAAFAVAAVALLLGVRCESWLGLPPEQALQILYTVTLAIELAIWSDEFCGHVAWLTGSKFTKRRGLGKWAAPVYGLVGMPALSVGQFALALLALIFTLLLAAFWPMFTIIAFLLSCLVMSHLFWDRQNIGGHGALPLIHTLFCLSMQADGNQVVVRGCIQILLGASYFGSALCKLATSLFIQRPRMWWGSGEGLKFYLLDSLSIRPMRGVRCAVREWILTAGPNSRPLLDIAMNGALLFELGVPVLMIFHARYAAVALYVFHYGVWFMFDIDFLSFWGPSLLALAVTDWPTFTSSGALAQIQAAVTAVPLRTCLLLLYTALQAIVAMTVYDLNPRRGELLPFSAYPMFEEATRLFRENQAMALVLRIPTEVPIPEPYYLRMSALSSSPSDTFLFGPDVLENIGQRVLVVGIPQQANARSSADADYVGGVWRPQKAKRSGHLENCATGITTVMGYCGADDCSACSQDASGSQALNHERECSASRDDNVIIAGNVSWRNAQWSIQQLIHHLIRMTPKDAWRPDRMRDLLAGYREAEEALARCPRAVSFREEMNISMCSTPVLKARPSEDPPILDEAI